MHTKLQKNKQQEQKLSHNSYYSRSQKKNMKNTETLKAGALWPSKEFFFFF